MTREKPSENNLSTAVETIRLLGKHVIELREIIEEQNKQLEKLETQQASLFDAYKELVGDFKMIKIDQRDVAKKLRDVVTQKREEPVLENKEEVLGENDVPDYEQIVAKYYPAYKNKKEVFIDKKDDDGGFSFARLPKFLNLD